MDEGGTQLLGVMLTPQPTVNLRRRNRVEEGMIGPHEVHWYRPEIAEPGAEEKRVTVIELGKDRYAQIWVDANFKEGQLGKIRIGQAVKVMADVYGDEVEYRGTVAGLAAGTGAAFALLPAQNATGNWIKVVQRVPVRIELDAKQLAAHPLRIGLSMDVTVDVRQRGGAALAADAAPTRVARTQVYGDHDDGAAHEIERIIAANRGSASAAAALPSGPQLAAAVRPNGSKPDPKAP